MLRDLLIAEIEAATTAAAPRQERPNGIALLANDDHATPGDYRAEIASASHQPGLAEKVTDTLASGSRWVEAARIGGDGRITLRLTPDALTAIAQEAIDAGEDYGRSDVLAGQRLLFEFVSAPPHVPLTVLHGRGGAVGDVLAALASASGAAHVQREFYANDADDSRPLRAFARAVLARYRQRCGVADTSRTDDTDFDANHVAAAADALYEAEGEAKAQEASATALPAVQQFALRWMRDAQRETLDALQIRFDEWFSERTLQESGAIKGTVADLLASHDAAKHADGSVWLLSSKQGDESDRVLLRADGSPTYLAGDLAYHRDKYGRGFDRLIDVWGTDHATYIPRTRAGLTALGFAPENLSVVLCAPVRVLRDGTEIKGDTRSGGGPTLAELIEQCGGDTLRFALLLKPAEQPLDLDMDALRRPDAPLARIRAAVLQTRSAAEHPAAQNANAVLDAENRAARIVLLSVAEFPSVVRRATDMLAPHLVAQYAHALADRYLALPKPSLSSPLSQAVGVVLENALVLLGIDDARN